METLDQPPTNIPVRPSRRWLRHLEAAAGYLFAIGGLIWTLHDIHLATVFRHMAGIRWAWVILAVILDVVTYYFQGWRWELILRPVGRISALRATQAVYVGVFTNEVFPLKMGEVVRGYLVSRWTHTSFSAVVPSIVVERFFDGAWLAIMVGICAIFVPLPHDLATGADILGIVIVAATAGFVYVAVRAEDRLIPVPGHGGRIKRALLSFLITLESGLRGIGKSKSFLLSLGVSFVLLLAQILSFWFVMLAYGLHLSFWVGAVVLLVVHLGTAIPNAPANIGSYQFFTVVGLVLFQVDKALATSFSLVVFFLLSLPLLVVGFVALHRSGMSFGALRREVGALIW
jgi:glycosyltransferase 2 family protein